jgi:glucosylceramidase
MQNASRRDFLKLAASVSGAVVASEARPLYAESPVAPRPVRGWRTTAQEKFQPIQSPPQWETGEELSPLAIYLEPATTYQEILGFGGAFTDASCYLLHLMEPDARHAFLADLYGPSGLRLSGGADLHWNE